MFARRPRQLVPNSPEYRWVSIVLDAVARRTGLPLRWNGHIVEELDPDAYGATEVDGTLSLSDGDVLTPIRNAYTIRALSQRDVAWARGAAATVVHEAVHLTSRLGDPQAPGAHPVHDAADEVLDEGLAEHWTHQNLNDVIRSIQMDQVVPGVTRLPTEDSYPASRAAVRSLLQRLTALTGRSEISITHELMSTERTQRWNSIADLAVGADRSQPTAPELRAHLANNLRADLAEANQLEASTQLTDNAKAQLGWHVGQRTAGGLEVALEDFRACAESPTADRSDLTALRAVLDRQAGPASTSRDARPVVYTPTTSPHRRATRSSPGPSQRDR